MMEITIPNYPTRIARIIGDVCLFDLHWINAGSGVDHHFDYGVRAVVEVLHEQEFENIFDIRPAIESIAVPEKSEDAKEHSSLIVYELLAASHRHMVNRYISLWCYREALLGKASTSWMGGCFEFVSLFSKELRDRSDVEGFIAKMESEEPLKSRENGKVYVAKIAARIYRQIEGIPG